MNFTYDNYWFFSSPPSPQPEPEPEPEQSWLLLLWKSFVTWYIFSVLLKIMGLCIDSFVNANRRRKLANQNGNHTIVGMESIKDEIHYYMDFIKNKNKYKDWKVKLPKGILLIGPPGTGKTLLVKSIAKELKIPIELASGSEFIEKYVGVGASRIRSLFSRARRHDKCIIFIDEIDAIGKTRGSDHNSERDTTLNQLLVEMDGFDMTDNIIVFAATNLAKTLDNALTRSGRFDKKIFFDPPNFSERKEMWKLYLQELKLPQQLTLEILSERTAGLTGADIATICNQTKINAIQSKKISTDTIISEKDIQEAIDEVMIGREKPERSMSPEEKKRVSYHEAGHALMAYVLKNSNPPIKVSIMPRGEAALGFSQQKSVDKKLYTKENILSHIMILLGGRCAEKIIYDNFSTGAADDIEKISQLVHQYYCKWGMSKDMGPLNPEMMGQMGKSIEDNLFVECQELMETLEKKVLEVLKKHVKQVKVICDYLLKEQTIDNQQFSQLLPNKLENSLDIYELKI